MIAVVFLLAQTTAVVSPPPVVTIQSNAVRAPDMIARESYTVDVVVRGGSEILFEGPLRVANDANTQVRNERAEPLPDACSRGAYDAATTQTSFSITLNPMRFGTVPSRLSVTVRWGRPGDAQCPLRTSGRTVEMNDTVLLAPGQTVSLKGDAGMTVQLRRR